MQQQNHAVASWWRQLVPAVREDLLSLGPQDFLPGHLAEDLRAFGVHVDDLAVALRLHGSTYAVHAQPPALVDFLAAERAWERGWRED